MKQQQAREVFADMTFPLRGVSYLSGYAQQPELTTPEGINVRAYDSLAFRARGGSRPGVEAHIDDELPHDASETGVGAYAFLLHGLGVGSTKSQFTLFGLSPAPEEIYDNPGLIQHLNFLIFPAGYAIVDPYIDNHRGWVRVQPEDPFDPIRLVPVDSPPLPEEPWTEENGGVHDPGGGDNDYVRDGGSAGSGPNDRETPVIIWEDPDDIFEDDPLTGTQLNAVAYDPDDIDEFGEPEIGATPLDGEYEYDPPIDFVLELGEDWPLEVTFTPDSDFVYRTASKTVHIDVVEAEIAFVQATTGTSTSSPAAVPMAAVAQDEFIVVTSLVTQTGGTPSTTAVSDTLGNTYTKIGDQSNLVGGAGKLNLTIWTAKSSSAGANTVSVSFAGGGVDIQVRVGITSYSGVNTSPSTDDVVTALGSGGGPLTIATVGPNSVAGNGRWLVAAFGGFVNGWDNAAVPNYSFRVDTSRVGVYDRGPVNAGSYSVTAESITFGGTWAAIQISLRPEA